MFQNMRIEFNKLMTKKGSIFIIFPSVSLSLLCQFFEIVKCINVRSMPQSMIMYQYKICVYTIFMRTRTQ